MKGPLIHINGTSAEALIDQQERLYLALSAAVDTALAATPNARDYYPLGAGAFEAARAAHSAMIASLVAARDATLAAADAIYDQLSAIEDRKVRS